MAIRSGQRFIDNDQHIVKSKRGIAFKRTTVPETVLTLPAQDVVAAEIVTDGLVLERVPGGGQTPKK